MGIETAIAPLEALVKGLLGLSKPQRVHMKEYLLGLMLPSERRRKSVKAINELVHGCDQSALNRFLNGPAGPVIIRAWVSHLADEWDDRPLVLIVDDSLTEHPWAEKMEGVAPFYDHCAKRFVQAHQLVTSILVDPSDGRIIPFLVLPYLKVEEFLHGCRCESCLQADHRMQQLGVKPCKCPPCRIMEFRTKNQLAQRIIETAKAHFTICDVSFDSWYFCTSTVESLGGTGLVSELRSNRWINPGQAAEFPAVHSGSQYKKRMKALGWLKLDEYAAQKFKEGAFVKRRGTKTLKKFNLCLPAKVSLSPTQQASALILYSSKAREFKYLVSINKDRPVMEFFRLWRDRWRIEEFHKDAKALGLGEYQLRRLCSVLIHGQLTFMACSLLKQILACAEEILGGAPKTVGECSLALKRILCDQNGLVPR